MTDPALAPPPTPGPAVYSLLAAAALLLLYIGLTLAMIVYYSDAQPPLWDHVLLIYNGFNAFAVAGGGVLLGTQIQRANVASANTETERVKQAARAALAATEPAKGVAPDSGLSAARAHLMKIL
jgi:hypothetical protein